MMRDSPYHQLSIAAALITLMAATRFGHFGSAISLPDASLAVYFLAGMYLPAWGFPLFLLEAGVVDYFAINKAGVSDWCVTPAYGFLIAAYAAPWLAGRWYASRYALNWQSGLQFLAAVTISIGVAFVISNASFYAFSGYFSDMPALEYASRVHRYLLPYMRSGLLWLGLAACVQVLMTHSQQRFQQHARS
jgi:hypothetical protein